MNRGEWFQFFIMGAIIGAITMGFLVLVKSDDFYAEHSKKTIGYTRSELDKLKADCEASLPRDKFCKLEIKAVEG